MRHKFAVTAAGFLLMVLGLRGTSGAVTAENLVSNGDFDSDLHDWTISFTGFVDGTAEWTDDDADNALDSGSMTVNAQGFGTTQLRSACVPVVSGADYMTGAAYKSYWGGGAAATLTISLEWWGDSTCSANKRGEDVVASASYFTGSSWVSVNHILSAPVGAASAYVRLSVRGDREFARTTVSGQFDDVALAPIVCGSGCGDPLPDTGQSSVTAPALVTASDALYILHGAVGEETCTPCICDVDASGEVSATDALLTLSAAAGEPVSLICPE